jgi:outer membrane lipoprotein
MKRQLSTISLIIMTGLLFSSCTTIPEQLQGEYTTLIPRDATEKDLETAVRWGGVVLETRPEENFTCFEILSRQLQKSMRPEVSDQNDGRYVACKPGFYDPETFKKGREVTLTGKLIYMDVRKVGEYDYQYPVVDIEFMSLWPKRRDNRHYRYYGMHQPYYWNYPPHRYYYRYPYW